MDRNGHGRVTVPINWPAWTRTGMVGGGKTEVLARDDPSGHGGTIEVLARTDRNGHGRVAVPSNWPASTHRALVN